jgi:superoxide dismutase, Cu-Zn family
MDRQAIRRALGAGVALPVMCAIVLGSGLVAASDDVKGKGDDQNKRGKAVALLQKADGELIGLVRFRPHGSKVVIDIRVWNVSPGFHGLHVHAMGSCIPSDFMSAGGHFNPDGQAHGSHAGDLPPLLVHADRTAQATVVTDRFRIAELFDKDGSAVILHDLRDNLANIPPRYGGADSVTLATGDAGSRLGCGVVR